MSRRITIEFLGKDSTSKTAASVERRFGKLGGELDKIGQKAGKVLAAGLTVGAVAAVKMGQKASDLSETISKTNAIFGEAAGGNLEKWAKGAATSLGQSQQTALDAAATFGIFGKSAGKSGTELAKFAKENTKLATDLASFHNTSPEEAIEALGAAFRGEAEPIRKYGILLDDATLRNEALKLGLIKTTKEALTPQQKVLAAQAAIMKQSSDAQGDFAKTSGGLAGQQKILKARFENLQTEIGTKVLPVMTKLAGVALKMVDWIDRNQRLVGILTVTLGGLAATLYAVSLAMRAHTFVTTHWSKVTKVATAIQKAFNWALRANPIGLVITALAVLAAGVVVAYKKSETFRSIVDKLWAKLKTLGSWLSGAGAKALAVFKDGVDRAGKAGIWMWNKAFQPAFKFIVSGVAKLMEMWAAMLRKLAKVPGFGWAGKAADAMQGAANKARGLSDDIKKIPNSVPIKFSADTSAARLGLNSFIRDASGRTISIGTRVVARGIAARAHGGPVRRGGVYAVGDNPDGSWNPTTELFVPNSSGRILNQRQMAAAGTSGGGGGGDVYINVNGALDPNAVATQIQKILLRHKRRTGGLSLGLA